MAYTSLFVDSAVASWKLGEWQVIDKIPVAYAIGHLMAAEGDTVSPDGNYLVALNKLSHGRHLSVGPSQPEASQLIDISQEKLKLLVDAFTEPEPHYAQIDQGRQAQADRGVPEGREQASAGDLGCEAAPASPGRAIA